MIHYHNENDEFQMDEQTVACIGNNTTVHSLREKMSEGPVPLKLHETHEKDTIMLYTREFAEQYGENPMDLAEVERGALTGNERAAKKWDMCVIQPWKFTSIIVSPKTDEDAGKVWGEINDGDIADQFVLLCETLPGR